MRKPIINFDIEFPSLRGEIKNYADNKLRVLKQDQNELNRQVFGLIVVGQFLPTDFALQGSEIIYNTVSEFVSNQLSLLLTELFSAKGRLFSGATNFRCNCVKISSMTDCRYWWAVTLILVPMCAQRRQRVLFLAMTW